MLKIRPYKPPKTVKAYCRGAGTKGRFINGRREYSGIIPLRRRNLISSKS